MQETEKPGETYQCAAVGAAANQSAVGGLRWETGYANRCRAALAGFLRMKTDHQRQTVVNLVTRDRIPYRGDSFEMYMDIAEEIEKMRQNPEAYKR